jgi:hypothetical protein
MATTPGRLLARLLAVVVLAPSWLVFAGLTAATGALSWSALFYLVASGAAVSGLVLGASSWSRGVTRAGLALWALVLVARSVAARDGGGRGALVFRIDTAIRAHVGAALRR